MQLTKTLYYAFAVDNTKHATLPLVTRSFASAGPAFATVFLKMSAFERELK